MQELRECLGKFGAESGKTGFIDGTSGHYTFQKLLKQVLGIDFLTYYFLTTNLPVEAKTLFYSPTRWNMGFLQFWEYITSAPTFPAVDIENGQPVFNQSVSYFEKCKISRTEEIAQGAVAAAKQLKHCLIDIPKLMWLDWCDSFMAHPTTEDTANFSMVRTTLSVNHDAAYEAVIYKPSAPRARKILGIALFYTQTKRIGEELRFTVRLRGLRKEFVISDKHLAALHRLRRVLQFWRR